MTFLVQCVLAIALFGLAPEAGAEKMKVGYWSSGFSLGFGAVMERMAFPEQEGLEVEWVRFAEVNGPTRAMPARAIDLAFGAPSASSMAIAANGLPVRIVLATQIAESQFVVRDDSPLRTLSDLRGRTIGMTAPPSAMHAIVSSVLEQNFDLKPGDYHVAPGNEGRVAQFLIQGDADAAAIRSVTVAQLDEVRLRPLGNVVEQWKRMTGTDAPPILAVTVVHDDYLARNPGAVARFIAATRKAVRWGSANRDAVAGILQSVANMDARDARAYASQWDTAYMASFEPEDIATLKRMNQVFRAAGTVTRDVPDSAFLANPYLQSKQIP